MTRRAPRSTIVFLTFLPLLTACPDPETCAGRGSAIAIDGVASYAIGSPTGYTLASSVTIYDYTEECSYDDEEFPIAIGPCTLWVALQQGPEPASRYFPGNPDAYGEIEPGQTCTMHLVGGTAVVGVTGGTVSFAQATTGVFLSGTVTAWSEGDGPTGELEWQLLGSGWPGGAG